MLWINKLHVRYLIPESLTGEERGEEMTPDGGYLLYKFVQVTVRDSRMHLSVLSGGRLAFENCAKSCIPDEQFLSSP